MKYDFGYLGYGGHCKLILDRENATLISVDCGPDGLVEGERVIAECLRYGWDHVESRVAAFFNGKLEAEANSGWKKFTTAAFARKKPTLLHPRYGAQLAVLITALSGCDQVELWRPASLEADGPMDRVLHAWKTLNLDEVRAISRLIKMDGTACYRLLEEAGSKRAALKP